jgi:hypothetical protein
MDKNAIATRLLTLRSLILQLKEEENVLRSQLEVGDSLEVPMGKVTLYNQVRTTYNETELYTHMMEEGIDISLVGEARVRVSREKAESAPDEIASILTQHREVTEVPSLKVTPKK